MAGTTLLRELAWDSFETGFLDGMLRLLLGPDVPCSFGALCGNIALSAGDVGKDTPPSTPTDCRGHFRAGRAAGCAAGCAASSGCCAT